MGSASPSVFVSHASEDKERFVLDFAARLRQRGVDVWLDRWEMLPGDSLVGKVFDEGIAKAQAVIVVLSRHSVAKPWVREELNAALVRKIDTASKLIPVVIDDIEVPACLLATIWEKIGDLKSYEASLDRIVLSILGGSGRPPLGGQPAFRASVAIGDLTRADSAVLQAACELCLEAGTDLQVLGGELVERCARLDVPEEAAGESIEVLKGRGYLEQPLPDNFFVTSSGFEEYLKAHRPDYDGLLRKLASLVVNQGMWEGKTIAGALNLPRVLLDHMLWVFEERKWILLQRYGGGGWEIAGRISPELKRWLES